MGLRFYHLVLFCLTLTACEQNNGRLFDEGSEIETTNFLDLTDDNLSKDYDSEIKTENLITIPEKLLRSSVTIIVSNNEDEIIGFGSGVFIESNFIATNHHVIEAGTSFKIKLNENKNEYAAIVYDDDEHHDIAILKIGKNFSDYSLKLQTKLPTIGTHILVAGSPEGLGGTISEGIVSSIRKDSDSNRDLIQISAPISPGSSGGPIINDIGELIGITVGARVTKESQNLNFGIPAKYIYNLMNEKKH